MKVGNRSKVGNREQRMQARFEKLVSRVSELEKENASLKADLVVANRKVGAARFAPRF